MKELDDFLKQPVQVQILYLMRNIMFKDHYNMIERHQITHGCIQDKMCMKTLQMQKKMHEVLDAYDDKIAEISSKYKKGLFVDEPSI